MLPTIQPDTVPEGPGGLDGSRWILEGVRTDRRVLVDHWSPQEVGPDAAFHRAGHLWLFAGACSIVAWIVGLHWAGEWPAALAVLLFLIPVTLALIGTLAKSHRAA
jgi:hypothetical protein